MHFLLYVCHPAARARTSLQARKQVARYLEEEHFVRGGRFCGHCDYFSIGGRWSGMLERLRLKYKRPKEYQTFLKKSEDLYETDDILDLFRGIFPDHAGSNIMCRGDVGNWGEPDDAQLFDQVLFKELRDGFDECVMHATPSDAPNVIFTDLDESEWPKSAKAAIGRHWVVVIDYHD